MKLNRWAVLLGAAVALLLGCEKEEEEVTGPGGLVSTPTHATVTVDKSTILSAGRDSSLWNIKLMRYGEPFSSVYTVNMLADRHGYFLKGGKREKRISLQTDASGETTVYFYGSAEPGISKTVVWGEGFGLDTVTVSVIVGSPYFVRIAFADPEEMAWRETDTLKSGPHFSRPDSTFVRATVLDKDDSPIGGVSVDLVPLVGGSPISVGQYGYFKSAPNPAAKSDGRAVTDALGNAMDMYYSDVLPFMGDPKDIEIVAIADSAGFGRISSRKFITVVVP